MLRLLRFLITGDWHLHKLVVLRTGLFRTTDPSGYTTGTYYDSRCEICGKVKSFRC